MTLAPVSRALNAAVLHMAARCLPMGYDVGADAPQDEAAMRSHYLLTGRVKVWNGASGDSIYADNEVNWAFRAWHDWAHLVGFHPFSLAGERAACAMQLSGLRVVYGDGVTTRAWGALLHADCIGQAEYHLQWKAFPSPQRPFVLAYALATTDRERARVLGVRWHNTLAA